MERKNPDIDSLFRLYYRPMCLYATHYLQTTEGVEDIVQDAFVSLYEKMKDGVEVRSPKAYLSSSVRNGCIDVLRRRQSHPEDSLPEDLTETLSDEETLSRSFDEAWLWTAIDKLPEGRRKILLMNKRDGLKYSEIAEQLDISERTVRNQLSRAMKTLREGAKKVIPRFKHETQ